MNRLHGILWGAGFFVSLMLFITLMSLGNRPQTGRQVLSAYRNLTGMLREKNSTGSWYLRSRQNLERFGASYHYGGWVEPIRFLVLRIVLGLAGVLGGIRYGVFWSTIGFVILFFLPMWLLLYLNKRDNEAMLPEVKLVYHALEIQIRAGVYVTDALAECYGSVQGKRLKDALLDLAGDIVMKADVTQSLEKLQAKFDNRYIDSLCITILQALESGQAVELLRDIGEQIKDMETAVMEKKKAALDRKLTFCQLGVLTLVLGAALYACVSYMFRTATFF